MNDHNQFKFTPLVLAIPLYFVLLLWIVYWFELKFGVNFNEFGILPRKLTGLRGILFGPFIHSDVAHLYHNSIPLFLLMLSLWYFYRNIALKIFITGTLVLGLLTWAIGRSSYHIGASGIIYMLFSFIFFSGIFRKYYRLIAVSLVVIFLYGSMVWYILPVEEKISWEGHLSGFVTGILLAYIFKESGPQRMQYDWEEDGFEDDEAVLPLKDVSELIPDPEKNKQE
ncbi:MAG: rhomboid family intramembrane serine protease [Flavobacteriaceae bacterium]|nr:rhomboid family intramembrane serine protease [Flavobacteriaceae bacterium]